MTKYKVPQAVMDELDSLRSEADRFGTIVALMAEIIERIELVEWLSEFSDIKARTDEINELIDKKINKAINEAIRDTFRVRESWRNETTIGKGTKAVEEKASEVVDIKVKEINIDTAEIERLVMKQIEKQIKKLDVKVK